MTVDEIISMSKEYCEEFELGRGAELTFEVLIRGAYEFGRSEGATSERERIIELNAPEIEKINAHFKTLEDALAAERERCAQICDSIAANAVLGTANECARAIRGQ